MYMMSIRFAWILLRKGTPERTLTGMQFRVEQEGGPGL
jgi:hypothetical protein